jgi:hypothetical protein
MLRPLLISVHRDDEATEPSQSALPTEDCVCCGGSLGLHAAADRCCAICTLVRHLERPRIDEEARLIWLPEMSQAALACLLREMHCRLRDAGENFDSNAGPAIVSPARNALHFASSVLSARADVAAEHLGTGRPSELAHVLARMSRQPYDRRHRLLGGLRVLPAGRFFVSAEDVYPAIVDSWREPRPPSRPSISVRSAD